MKQELFDQDITGFIAGTKLASTFSDTEIKKLMFSIANDVSGGDPQSIGKTGKVGAYGFNLEALQEVGAVVPNAVEKTLENIKKKVGDPLAILTKKTWIRSAAADPLGKLGLSGLTGKNLGKNFALDALNKLKIGIPSNLSLSVANNLNFAALADPKVWVAKPGSAADIANKAVSGAVGKAQSLVSNTTTLISSTKNSIQNTINSATDINLTQRVVGQSVNKLSNSLQASVTKTATDIQTSFSVAKIPSASKIAFNAATTSIVTSSSTVNRSIDASFDEFRRSGDLEDLEIASTAVTQIISDFKEEIDDVLTDTLSEQTVDLGGGSVGFLNDIESQNNAMLSLLDRNLKSLISSKVVDSNSSPEIISGLLAVANGQGIDTAIKFARGMVKTSSDGKTSLDYFNIGSLAKSLLDDGLNPKKIIPVANDLLKPAQAIANSKPTIANQPTNEALKPTDPNKGFKDPNNVYPRKEYLESGNGDVNPLAVGKNAGVKTVPEQQTIHGQHDAERTRSKTVAGRTGESVSQPKSAFASKYPHNHTYQSESGHTLEFDDTPHAERVSLNHRSGTFQEMRPDGSQVSKIVGDGYTVIDRNGTITIEGRANVHVGGSCNIYVANNCNLTVGGNTAIDMHGNVDWKVGGNLTLAVKGTFASRVDGDYSLDVSGDIDSATSKSYRLGSATSVDVLSNGKINIDASSDINIKSDAKANIYGKTTNIKASGKTNVQAGSTLNLKGGGATNVDGAVITVNPGSAGSADTAADGTPPDITVVSDPVSPMTPSEPEFASGGGVSPDELKGMDYDGEDGVTDPNAAGIEDTPTPGEEDSADVASSKVPAGACNVTKKGTKLPDINISNGVNYGMKISDYFTLKDVMVKGKLRAYGGFSKADMIANMRCLAVNCLDPIKAKYPGLYLTSGFRDYIPEGGSTTSQHMLGQAADMKFNGHSKADYFNIVQWIAKNVPYDQLLLEYLPSGGHWIHISFKSSGNRYQHFTMYNHKRVSAPGTFKKY